jgi:flavodoxin
MKVLVSYYSDTGNTKEEADAVYDAIEESEKGICPA